MNKIILDSAILAALPNLDHFAELCDPSGRTLGYFTPAVDPALYAELDVVIDEDELLRRAKEDRRYTTAEVIEHLERLSRGENA